MFEFYCARCKQWVKPLKARFTEEIDTAYIVDCPLCNWPVATAHLDCYGTVLRVVPVVDNREMRVHGERESQSVVVESYVSGVPPSYTNTIRLPDREGPGRL